MESPPELESVIAGFWRRTLAFAIDGMIFSGIGLVAGLLLFDLLADLGAWGRVLGFGCALVYFAIMDSRIANGQTLGKRILRIRVVSAGGQPISVGKAAARYSILAAPLFLNGLMVPATATTGVIGYLISFVLFGLGGALAYLFVFNRRTRQSVHDLVVGTYVTRSDSTGQVSASIWRPHLAIVASWLGLVAIGGVAAMMLTQALPDGLMDSVKAIEETGKVHTASVFIGKSWGSGGETRYVTVRAVLKDPISDEDALAAELAGIVLSEFPEANDVDTVDVTLVRGFDIGFASAWRSTGQYRSPSEWLGTSGG